MLSQVLCKAEAQGLLPGVWEEFLIVRWFRMLFERQGVVLGNQHLLCKTEAQGFLIARWVRRLFERQGRGRPLSLPDLTLPLVRLDRLDESWHSM